MYSQHCPFLMLYLASANNPPYFVLELTEISDNALSSPMHLDICSTASGSLQNPFWWSGGKRFKIEDSPGRITIPCSLSLGHALLFFQMVAAEASKLNLTITAYYDDCNIPLFSLGDWKEIDSSEWEIKTQNFAISDRGNHLFITIRRLVKEPVRIFPPYVSCLSPTCDSNGCLDVSLFNYPAIYPLQDLSLALQVPSDLELGLLILFDEKRSRLITQLPKCSAPRGIVRATLEVRQMPLMVSEILVADLVVKVTSSLCPAPNDVKILYELDYSHECWLIAGAYSGEVALNGLEVELRTEIRLVPLQVGKIGLPLVQLSVSVEEGLEFSLYTHTKPAYVCLDVNDNSTQNSSSLKVI